MKILWATFISLAFVNLAWAADVEIEWIEPDNYTDIEPEYLDDSGGYRDNLFSRFEDYLGRLSDRYLNDEATLKLKVHDWNMAGRVVTQTGADEGGQPKRRVLDNEYPMMQISYQLINSENETLREGENVELRGRAIRTEGRADFPSVNRRDRELIGPEIKMLNRWFKENFIES